MLTKTVYFIMNNEVYKGRVTSITNDKYFSVASDISAQEFTEKELFQTELEAYKSLTEELKEELKRQQNREVHIRRKLYDLLENF